MKSKTDILSFTYSSRGRDVDIVEPVLSKLEKDLDITITRKWLYDNFVFDILKYRPKLVIDANAIGCRNHLWACRFASMMGCKVVTFVSEGDYRYIDGSITTMLFGWNTKERLYEDLHLEWSQRNIEYFKTSKGYDNNKIKLSGATGFDKYSLLSFMDRQSLLSKYKKDKFTKVVTLAGYTFDFMFNENHSTGPIYFGKELEGIKASLFALQDGYLQLVKNNPDILFVAKKHPLTENKNYDEFSKIEKFKNVLILQTEENVFDVINVCDILIAFESTTALEAWLLKKHTLLYNPIIQKFNRSSISEGSPIIENIENLQKAIDEYYSTGGIKLFADKENDRLKIIKDVIGFADGKNYQRAAAYIEDLYLNKQKNKIEFSFFFFIHMIILGTRNYLRDLIVNTKIFRRFARVNHFYLRTLNDYTDIERIKYKGIYSKAIDKFEGIN